MLITKISIILILVSWILLGIVGEAHYRRFMNSTNQKKKNFCGH